MASTYSCSISGPGCSRETCVRNHRKSSKSVVSDRLRTRLQSHLHRTHHLHSLQHHLQCSCEQCGRPFHTCSTPGLRRRHHQSIRRPYLHRLQRSWGNRARYVRSHRSGNMTSLSEGRCTHGSHGLLRRSCSKLGCRALGSHELDESCRRLGE